VPFSQLKINAELLAGLRDLGFNEPTPIQADAIPPGLEGRDLLACAMTGSGKTVAFLVPIVQKLMTKPRRTTRALVLTPTRELAAQILEQLNDLAVHTPVTGAAVFGGVGMGPQEHAFRSGEVKDALVFLRTKHRVDRLTKQLAHEKVSVARIHGNRSQAQRTEALTGFKSGKYQVLVATDVAARGIDVTALGHVINYDVPAQPDDYIHRVGRTARAQMTGSAFTLASPEEEGSVRGIEKAINKRLPRVTLPDFDYTKVPEAPGVPSGRGPRHHHSSSRPGSSHPPRRGSWSRSGRRFPGR